MWECPRSVRALHADDVRPVVDRSYNEILLLKFRAVNTTGNDRFARYFAKKRNILRTVHSPKGGPSSLALKSTRRV